MSSRGRRGVAAGWCCAACIIVALCTSSVGGQTLEPAGPLAGAVASPQSEAVRSRASVRPSEQIVTITSTKDLMSLDPGQLQSLYRSASCATIPPGKLRGRVFPYPGTKIGRPASKMARLIWQGKVVRPDGSMAVNRFFGVRAIQGRLYQGESWLDGGPALILDYQETSRVYARYRDEIREVAPGVYLGLMYERTQPAPMLKTYFALDAPR